MISKSFSRSATRKASTVIVAAFAFVLVLSYGATAQSEFLHPPEVDGRTIVAKAAAIQNEDDLGEYLSIFDGVEGGSPVNPFGYLSEEGRYSFLASLTFGTRGLGSFNYGILEGALSPTETYQLLSLFGVQHVASTLQYERVETQLDKEIIGVGTGGGGLITPMHHGDIEDHWCSSRATCSYRLWSICIHDNC